MYRNVLLGGAAAIALAVGSAPALSQETLNLTVAAGHPEVFLWVKHLKETFVPTVDAELAKTGKVKINWTQGYGGTIVKLGSEVDAFQQGIIDVGQMSGVFKSGHDGPAQHDLCHALRPARRARRHRRRREGADGDRRRAGEARGGDRRRLHGGGIAIDDYNIASTKELSKIADMNGVKIGSAGPNLAWLAGTGAVGVQGSYVSFYNDIKTGVYRRQYGWMTANVTSTLRGRAQLEPDPFRRDVYRRDGRLEANLGHLLGRNQGGVQAGCNCLHQGLLRRAGGPLRGGRRRWSTLAARSSSSTPPNAAPGSRPSRTRLRPGRKRRSPGRAGQESAGSLPRQSEGVPASPSSATTWRNDPPRPAASAGQPESPPRSRECGKTRNHIGGIAMAGETAIPRDDAPPPAAPGGPFAGSSAS